MQFYSYCSPMCGVFKKKAHVCGEHWCYRRMLKVSWKDKVKNTEVLSRMAEKEPRFYENIARQKMAYAGHVLRGSSGLNALLIMEGKISGVKARGRPRSAWTDDLKDWTH